MPNWMAGKAVTTFTSCERCLWCFWMSACLSTKLNSALPLQCVCDQSVNWQTLSIVNILKMLKNSKIFSFPPLLFQHSNRNIKNISDFRLDFLFQLYSAVFVWNMAIHFIFIRSFAFLLKFSIVLKIRSPFSC